MLAAIPGLPPRMLERTARPPTIDMLPRTLLLLWLASGTAFAADKHLGVASCATSVCHGKQTAQAGRDVALNEYVIWLEQDRHSQAYRALDNTRSRSIAANLGLPSASTAKICLDCHAD